MFKIRKATTKDVPQLLDLWNEFMIVHDSTIIKQNPQLKEHLVLKKDARKIFENFLRQNLASKDSYVLVAQEDKKLIGYSLSFIKANNPIYTVEKTGRICDLFVSKQYQGQGISSRLKDETFKWFAKKKIKHVSLIVFHDNIIPKKIYKKWGFFEYSIEMRKKV